MKKIDRSSVEMPVALADAESPAAIERAKVKQYYSTPKEKSYAFKVYKSPSVVESIELLFNGKCAYCESRYMTSSPTDIEHFRPKARISDEPAHTGYWWLASSWTNLLASCIMCNRTKKGQHFDPATGAWSNSLRKSGKLDNFPLAPGSTRAVTETDLLDNEDPLLIDPTQRDPSQYLAWSTMYGVMVLVPNQERSENSAYAEASIRIYGLNRRKLVEARTGIALAIRSDALAIANEAAFAATLSQSALREYMPLLEARVNAFVAKKENDPEYAGMVEYLVNAELQGIAANLGELRSKLSNTDSCALRSSEDQ
ncbi:hypothetical protein [Stenotrophomonas sp. YAU14A_MKIMI4_1]|uniref:hypothetical protein n=1 Tax=Stenotrophomonas sp. YAU14A_MKIMI4_1 TaxID=2072408 RepID=UPI00131F121B|nr:hypothetical protein [Stenotrophomonas sp. YAU14A_MKIMI4_1]